jgi:hypothetical protein
VEKALSKLGHPDKELKGSAMKRGLRALQGPDAAAERISRLEAQRFVRRQRYYFFGDHSFRKPITFSGL